MRPQHSPRLDDGMSLVETVVAMMVFAVFSLLAVAYLVSAQQVGAGNTQRVAAANLAAQQIELVRSSRTLDLPDGTTVLPNPPVLSGTTYTLTQQVRFVAGPDGASVCTGGNDRLAYKLVTVSVTWPRMGAVKPVRTDTLKALGIGATQADARKGSAAVAVVDHEGKPRAGVTVELTPGPSTATTGADGCVVFPNLATGVLHTARLSAVDHVGLQGEPNPTTSFSVTAGKVTKTSTSYAPKAALSLTATAPQAGFPVPTTLGITVDGANLLPTRRRGFADCSTTSTAPQSCVQGTPRLASALFPGTYEAWAGRCLDARPATPPSATAGTTAAALTSALGGVRATLSATAVTNLTGRRVFAEHAADAGCPAGEVYELSTVTPADRRSSLPVGSWTLVARNADGSEYSRGAAFVVAAGAVVELSY